MENNIDPYYVRGMLHFFPLHFVLILPIKNAECRIKSDFMAH